MTDPANIFTNRQAAVDMLLDLGAWNTRPHRYGSPLLGGYVEYWEYQGRCLVLHNGGLSATAPFTWEVCELKQGKRIPFNK